MWFGAIEWKRVVITLIEKGLRFLNRGEYIGQKLDLIVFVAIRVFGSKELWVRRCKIKKKRWHYKFRKYK